MTVTLDTTTNALHFAPNTINYAKIGVIALTVQQGYKTAVMLNETADYVAFVITPKSKKQYPIIKIYK